MVWEEKGDNYTAPRTNLRYFRATLVFKVLKFTFFTFFLWSISYFCQGHWVLKGHPIPLVWVLHAPMYGLAHKFKHLRFFVFFRRLFETSCIVILWKNLHLTMQIHVRWKDLKEMKMIKQRQDEGWLLEMRLTHKYHIIKHPDIV